MSDLSARLALPFLAPAQAQKHVTHNEALARLDMLVQLVVEAFDAETPPATPAIGAVWALGVAPSGDWAGQSGLAAWDGVAWVFVAPQPGWVALARAEGRLMRFDGAGWVPALAQTDGLDGIGIGTAADAVNRLAVAAEATLLSHDGAGHRLTLNKAATTDTASLLFQTGWSGRAEMGTAGSDAFAIKLSADGAAWTDALILDPATGAASGASVQNAATDTTPGRLALASHVYGPGNLVGPVSGSGSAPTGAVIETGTTADGTYTRFADGTQIATALRSLAQAAASVCTDSWTYPAAFAAVPAVTVTLDDVGSGAPGESDIAAPRAALVSATGAQLRVPRITGGPDFVAGDTVTVSATAVGRWA